MSFLNLLMTKQFISVISDGQITEQGQATEHFYQKFQVSPQNYIVGITGYQKITNDIRKKFYYQQQLDFTEAIDFLENELNNYKDKFDQFSKIKYNALIAGFTPDENHPKAYVYHIEAGKITKTVYKQAASISFIPDDIDFNPNQLFNQTLRPIDGKVPQTQMTALQRSLLLKIASQSQTVNHSIFQEIIYPNLAKKS